MRRFISLITAFRKALPDRLTVGFAAVLLSLAVVLVRLGRLSLWSRSLGTVRKDAAIIGSDSPLAAQPLAAARRIGHQVERAAQHLPFTTKCLPRAMAVQWLLRLRGVPSSLAIAVHLHERSGDHAYHAWVECGGVFIIGHCERALYRPVMFLDSAPRSARRPALR